MLPHKFNLSAVRYATLEGSIDFVGSRSRGLLAKIQGISLGSIDENGSDYNNS